MEKKNFSDFKSSLKPKHIIAFGQAQSLNFYNCSVCFLCFVIEINVFRGSSEASGKGFIYYKVRKEINSPRHHQRQINWINTNIKRIRKM